jgi:hypothetical protein
MLKLQSFVLAAALALATPALAQTRPAVTTPPILDGAALSGPAPALESVRGSADRLSMHPTVSPERLAQASADNR